MNSNGRQHVRTALFPKSKAEIIDNWQLPGVKQGVYVPNLNYGELGLVKKRDPVPSSIKDFDYLLEIRDPHFEIPAGISLKEVGRGQTFRLYRIDQGTAK